MRAACCLPSPLPLLSSPLRLLSSFPFYRVSFSQPPSLFPCGRGVGGEGGGSEQQDPGSSFRSFVLCPMDVSVFSVPTSLPPTFRGSLSAASFRPRRLRMLHMHVACIHSSIPKLMAFYDSGAQSQPQEASPRLHVELRSHRGAVERGTLRITFSEASFPSPGRRRRRRVAYS